MDAEVSRGTSALSSGDSLSFRCTCIPSRSDRLTRLTGPLQLNLHRTDRPAFQAARHGVDHRGPAGHHRPVPSRLFPSLHAGDPQS
ncbi:hypothetical protein G6F32_014547 [Rhizopus arrhizus]|nr:hypothetical protein G6F32_014547 [Rhizopus arrhizus]